MAEAMMTNGRVLWEEIRSVQENNDDEVIMSNDDVLGEEVPSAQQIDMQNFCYKILLSDARGPSQVYPGSHAVYLNRENLQLLGQRYYYVTWKGVGSRYMMLITMGGCFLIDRKFCFRRVQKRFPSHHRFTLLDGEMIIRTCRWTKIKTRVYCIYDVMAINGESVVERPFHERREIIDKYVIKAWSEESVNRDYGYLDWDWPFVVVRKEFWELGAVKEIVKDFVGGHEIDGLIFQCRDDPYVPRTHEGLLKWKYGEMNSVDFIFEIGNENQQLLFLHDQGIERIVEGNGVVFRDCSDPWSYSRKIIQCCWDSKDQVWMCMRVRLDKCTPNDWDTYKKVLRSIRDNITEQVLLAELEKIFDLPMYVVPILLTRFHYSRIQMETLEKEKALLNSLR